MFACPTQLLLVVRSWFARGARLEAENLVLQQLIVLRRKSPKRARLWKIDHLMFIWLCRLYPSLLGANIVVQPETVIRWHRRGFRAYWRWRYRHVGGRPRIDSEVRALIPRMNREDRLWGAPRIHGELLMLGIEVTESTVGRYMVHPRRPPSQRWKTDLPAQSCRWHRFAGFVRTISFMLLYGLAILCKAAGDGDISLTDSPTAEWIAGQVTDSFPWAPSARPIPVVPWQNGHVERLIGFIRRESLDHLIMFDEAQLRRVLKK